MKAARSRNARESNRWTILIGEHYFNGVSARSISF
jgi:hypothetical protein